MLNSLKLYVGSLTHEAKRELSKFRDLIRLARCRDVTTAWRHSDDISKEPQDHLTIYGVRGDVAPNFYPVGARVWRLNSSV